jgi:hypothetical protein
MKVGAFAVSLVLALAVPCIAFAANTATFSSVTPANKASVSTYKPLLSVIVYDKYGVTGSANYSLTLDGVKKTTKLGRYSGYGLRKFKLSYAVPSNLGVGNHTWSARVKDAKGHVSTVSWSFTVLDTTAPSTTSNAVANYNDSATIHLSATDNVAVTHTYSSLDFGTQVEGVNITVTTPGRHFLFFWSVDAAGNIEAQHMVPFVITQTFAQFHKLPNLYCATTPGCHNANLAVIHQNHAMPAGQKYCQLCHTSDGVTPSNSCTSANCHPAFAHLPASTIHAGIVSASGIATQTCTQAICHGNSGVLALHTGGCQQCHASERAGVQEAILAGDAKCESCHSFTAIHDGAAMTAGHTVAGSCFTPYCHGTDVSKMHTIDFRGTGTDTIPGCFVCHAEGTTPSTDCQSCHDDIVSPHNYAAAHAGAGSYTTTVTAMLVANSSACVSCHKSDLTKVMLLNPGSSGIPTSTTGFDEHKGCSCHSYGIAGSEGMDAGQAACQNCHAGAHAPHSFGGNAGGHSTTTYGNLGAHTLFDGTEGVVVKNSANETITQEWPLPSAGVFWSQSARVGTDSPLVAMANRGFASAADGAAAVNTTVGWGSVITCQDCHTGLVAAGPQGANVANFGLDPNFPDDWKNAELTTWDPTGMRSVATTVGTTNPYYPKVWSGYVGVGNSSQLPTVPLTTTGTASNGYSMGSLPGRFICQKCHKLTDTLTGYPSQNRSGRSQQGQGVSNSAHMEHHPDQILGQANCVSCHVAIPHGWTRPRLLVYETDPAPYKAAQPTTTTVITVGGVNYMGNWNYSTVGGTKSTHLDSIFGGAYTASLETSPVVPGYGKELVHGYAPDGWSTTKLGVEWIAPGTETGAGEGQPNCNGCSATGSTHTPASEGVPAGLPLWK